MKIRTFLLGLILILLAVSIFSLAGCTGAITAGIDDCSSLNGLAKDDCYLQNLKCSKISDSTVRDSCVVELAKIKSDLKVCELVKAPEAKDYCQEQIAEKTKDSKICDTIKTTYWKENCYYNLGIQQNDKEFCHLITNDEQRWDCFEIIAYAANNYQLCEYLPNPKQSGCYFQTAKRTLDFRPCELISEEIIQDSCLINVAKKGNLPELCQKIGYKEIKANCIQYFNQTEKK